MWYFLSFRWRRLLWLLWLRRELRDHGVGKNLQFWPQSFGVLLEFSYIERRLFLWNFWGIFKDNSHLKFLILSSNSLQVVANRFKSLGFSLCFTQKTVNGSEPFFPVMKLVSSFTLKPLGSFLDSWERKNGTYYCERLKCFPLLFKGPFRPAKVERVRQAYFSQFFSFIHSFITI